MIEKILSIIPTVLLSVSSVSFTISAIIQYLSCDSCKLKRQEKLLKLSAKITNMESKKNG